MKYTFTLQNGIFTSNNFPSDKYLYLFRRLRKDLLDYNIKFYKPVGFYLGKDSNSVYDNINKIQGLGYSHSELSFLLSDIIMAERVGVKPRGLYNSAASKLDTDCSFITLNGTDIGTEYEGSIFVSGEGMTTYPNLLLKNTSVITKLRNSVSISLVLMNNCGIFDFRDSLRLLYNTDYKPIRSVYDLGKFFTINHYTGGNHLKFIYKQDLDEEVLLKILSEHIDSWEDDF